MQKKISILGCGWLGLPLAETFVLRNYMVAGSTTSPAKLPLLVQKNILPFLLDLNDLELNPENQVFFESEVLVVNVPPKRNSNNAYAHQISNLKKVLLHSPVEKIIFISSTSVYAPAFQEITEESLLEDPENNELLKAEEIIGDLKNPWQTTIIRFAGLFGPGREPGRFLAGKTNLPDPEMPVNLIHLDDCLQIIQEVIKQEKWQEVYNACADEHPKRFFFYEAAARKLNLPEPTFTSEITLGKPFKLISNQKLKTDLNYTFKFPDPLKLVQN